MPDKTFKVILTLYGNNTDIQSFGTDSREYDILSVEELIGCHECVYHRGDYNYCCNDIFSKPDGYCSYAKRAERKDDEVN